MTGNFSAAARVAANDIAPFPLEWRKQPGLLKYPQAVAAMEERVAGIHDGTAAERIWLVEHPPLYTAGTSTRPEDLLDAGRFPVFESGRGGQLTYHGPGQRVAYVMVDLARRGRDLRAYIRLLERWVIDTLSEFGVRGEVRDGRVGVWVDLGAHGGIPGTEAKIAAIGVRVRRWVTFHGLSLNIEPDLEHFSGIVPCGLAGFGVTSLHALGHLASFDEVDAALRFHLPSELGVAEDSASA